ncbi:family 20 glycosylhydrolase [Algoriphagus hitonicola]|uniref:beta-N-acetylhexosaminidase n=1 Tax=Algoriphagus hitonicola TaxID=435880 RepID=A0A1I2WUD8_9BACT|nr:family 20 glycosylhydrolase [Algoriphagus hitonicola]SFH04954.1 hexosaminidase [Algoriphagus hitonicola]
MRKLNFLFYLLIFFACSSAVEKINGDFQVEWRLDKNQFGTNASHQATFIFQNDSDQTLTSGWKLYFNSVFLDVNARVLDDHFQIRHLAGDFFVLAGNDEESPALKPGQKLEISYTSTTPFFKNSHAPEGLILVKSNGSMTEIRDFKKSELTVDQLDKAVGKQGIIIPTAERIYKKNEIISELPNEEIPPFLPIPKSWKYLGEPLRIKNAGLGVLGDKVFEQAAKTVTQQIQVGYKPENDRSVKPIQIRIAKKESIPAEGYHLEIRDQRVLILASDPKGAFYGVQSFLALMPADFWEKPSNEILLPQIEIDDVPDYAYRGFFLDVARNFIPKESIFKLLDLMAFYKLNKFHFNLANDEGWRIEIPGLPELTDYASKRGVSEDESDMLWPFYGSGASADNKMGTGFYTVEDFKEIIQYADERFIEIIPEIGVPAHSRAAIKAMEKRFEKYKKSGNEEDGLKYRLIDPDDNSVYLSAQNFRDNTICVCQESTYSFYEKVVLEIKKMYESNQIPLKTWHTGGDEVPKGVWTDSPVCDQFLEENPDWPQSELLDYFRSRIEGFLKNEGIQLAGWEEVGLKESQGEIIPNERFANQDWMLYAWNSVPGWGGEDRAYQLANAGYPVIISSSANFYFDLAYDWDPREPGHVWSGVSDVYQAWKTVPRQLYLSHDLTIDGIPWPWEGQKSRFVELTPVGKRNIIGVQGQLWTETIRSVEMMEYYLFPKMLGLVERAWNGDPNWSNLTDRTTQLQKRNEEWNEFSNVLGQKEIPRLEAIFGGVNLRIPTPGLKKVGEEIWANVENPGLEIRWTSDGSIPSQESNLYTEKIPFQEGLKFRAFGPKGSASKVSSLD